MRTGRATMAPPRRCGYSITMANTAIMRSGNPALSDDTFRQVRVGSGEVRMTLAGTVEKTGLSLLILTVAAAWTWNLGLSDPRATGLVLPGLIGGFIAAMATTFRPTWAPITTPIYAALEGLALGGISLGFETRYPGIVSQAVFLTFGTLAALLIAYRSGLVQPTENLKLGIAAATGGIAVLYLVGFMLSFFGIAIPLIHGSGPIGIAFSLVVVGIAAFNLVLDFDFIEQGAERGAPKYMEWYGAFGLLVTLVWLYFEILRLLSKLQDRR
jgi:uncharacterized YccA/Bax inhibitor family protein